MKLYLVITLLFSPFIFFSQTKDKEMLVLIDSIKAVEPYECLYAEINTLSAENRSSFIKLMSLRQHEAELKEFFFRQVLYTKVFDQLESGIILNPLLLEQYSNPEGYKHWIAVDWRLFEIPKSDSKSPIIVFIDPDSDILLKESPTFKNYPFNDIGLAFKNGDSILKKRYPKVYTMIKKGQIIFENHSFKTPNIVALQVPKLEFPSQLFANASKSPESKQKLAANLLSWISDEAAPVLGQYDATQNLVPAYLQLEKEKLKKATIDQKIDLRIKFIEYIRKNVK